MGRLGLTLLVVVLALLPVGAVSAGAPVQNTGVWQPEPFALGMCDFPVIDSPVADYREQIFFDDDGNFTKWRWHGNGTDYLTAPGTSDVVLTGPFSIHEQWDEARQEFTVSGMDFAITIPGYGAVLFEAGRLLPDGRIVGIHTGGDPDTWAILCSVLAGN